jgi:hypothetical protein
MKHISELPKVRGSVCIVGKGPSYAEWKNQRPSLFICCNSAIEKVRQGYLIQRDKGPIFDWDGPMIGPTLVAQDYADGYGYNWSDIPKLCSGVTAIYLALLLGATRIHLVGFDNLIGDSTYHPDFPQNHETEQWQWGLRQQKQQFASLADHGVTIHGTRRTLWDVLGRS